MIIYPFFFQLNLTDLIVISVDESIAEPDLSSISESRKSSLIHLFFEMPMTVRPVSFVLMMKFYQKPRGLIPKNNIKPNCPYCRAKPPPHMLKKLPDRPKRNSPPERNIFNLFKWQQAERRNYLRNRNWDGDLPFAQDPEFMGAMWEMLFMYVHLSKEDNRSLHLRTFDWNELRHVSIHLASTKRKAI